MGQTVQVDGEEVSEATMLNAFRAYTKACIAMPGMMSILQVSMTEPNQSFGVRSTPVYNGSHSFNEESFELQLPFFLENSLKETDMLL